MTLKLGQHKATGHALNALSRPATPTKKLQMNLPEELHKSFKITCLKHDRDMTDVTASLIQQWIKDNQ